LANIGTSDFLSVVTPSQADGMQITPSTEIHVSGLILDLLWDDQRREVIESGPNDQDALGEFDGLVI
jgi:hypothetical protein